MYFGDLGFFLLIPTIIFAMYAQGKVKRTFNKYLKKQSASGYTGYQVARTILDRNGLHDVNIEMVRGKLSDHYDPRKRVLRLSKDVYERSSIASVGVAAHEVGHAIQHSEGYFPLLLRNNIAPIASFGARFVWILVFGGLILSIGDLVYIGVFLYLAVVAFQIITLPVEFNASNRAVAQLNNGIISAEDIKPTKKVLSAAALTYVAATLVGIAQLIRLLLLANRD
ncbi:zinc metallopeptidase [Clostridium sp. D2Q-11]|uniref:Zinc metallopeptidase n=1 Tax=Anaeromonas frigoriresistens TaxID=2683708 RepID=A0A942Z757_9FIRM|nr:zinc metallopeptidase [Anaeromonas frigoriresistens]MBS4538312.1 zinc metallopeptidase [Anaeromonas frigoriresistens]